MGAPLHIDPDAARWARHAIGARWQVDETYVKVGGQWRYVYRAVDEYGQVIDVYVSSRRDSSAARRFFDCALDTAVVAPIEVVTDQAAAYPRVLEEVLPAARHLSTCRYPAGDATICIVASTLLVPGSTALAVCVRLCGSIPMMTTGKPFV